MRLVNRIAIAIFAVMSGLYKCFGGDADVDLFADVGLSAAAVSLFGGVQTTAGLLLFVPRVRVPAAALLTACNAFATYALFASGVQPFGVISLIFVVMAVAAAW